MYVHLSSSKGNIKRKREALTIRVAGGGEKSPQIEWLSAALSSFRRFRAEVILLFT